jgi:hypothetical protein
MRERRGDRAREAGPGTVGAGNPVFTQP